MSSRTPPNAKPKSLSDNDLERITAEIEAGRPPMVWFTAAAVGVTEGRSGKVVALGDPSDGDFLQIRPTGSKDVLSFGPSEVTMTKPPRDRTTGGASAASGATAAKKKGTPVPSAASSQSAPSAASATAPKNHSVSNNSATPSNTETPKSARAGKTKTAAQPNAVAETKPAPAARTGTTGKAGKTAAARKTKIPEVTVTLNGSAEGEWTVDVMTGKKRTARALPVPGHAVAQAAKLLHPEVAEVVDGLLETVRDAQQARVQQLQDELEQARKVLQELSD